MNTSQPSYTTMSTSVKTNLGANFTWTQMHAKACVTWYVVMNTWWHANVHQHNKLWKWTTTYIMLHQGEKKSNHKNGLLFKNYMKKKEKNKEKDSTFPWQWFGWYYTPISWVHWRNDPAFWVCLILVVSWNTQWGNDEVRQVTQTKRWWHIANFFMVWGFWLAVSVFQATALHIRGYVKTIWTGIHFHSLKITLNGILKEGCNYKHTLLEKKELERVVKLNF